MRLRVLIVALIAIGVLIPTALLLRQERAAGASMVLSVLDGSADVARGSADFVRASDGLVLSAGDRVRTADRSHAVVTFLDGSTVEVEPATTITVVEASAAPDGAIAIRLEQALGRTWSSVQRLSHADSRFEITSPVATATVRGTGFVTDVSASGATSVKTTDGFVEVSAQGQTVVVPAGSLTGVQPGGPPSPPVPGPAPQNTLRFGLHSPAHLVVVDPLGRACGILPIGPTVVRQIPGCLATVPGIEPQLVDLPDATAGTYSLLIESIAPGGDFVASASAIDAAGSLSFNYFLSGGGPQGTKFGSSLEVESGPNGSLMAAGLSKLTLADRAPRVVVLSTLPRPSASGTPNASSFPLLPRFGFTAGIEVTPAPGGRTVPPGGTPDPSVTPSPTAPPAPTEAAALEPTRAPTPAPVRTLPPPPPPTTPAPTPTPTPQPTPSPTPTPTPSGPILIGGVVSPGSPVTLTGHGWSTARVTLSWEDGRPLLQVTADAAGDFALAWTVPITTTVGVHSITASDGQQTATGQIAVYAPALAVSCGSTTTSISLTGSGWPPGARYAIRSSLLTTPLSGTVGADGTFDNSFVPPSGTLPGDYQFNASAGTLLAEPQSCTLR